MKKGFSGDLSGLKPYERFQLSTKAAARGDIAFYKQLLRSCPRREVVEYLALLNAASNCTIEVTLAIHIVLGQWEAINHVIQETFDSRHIDYYYSRYRDLSYRSGGAGPTVEEYFDALSSNTTYADSLDISIRANIAKDAMVVFLPFLFRTYYLEPGTAYLPEESGFLEGFVECCRCVIDCYCLEKARGNAAAALGQLWLAFGSVCRSKMGLEPDIVIRAYGPPAAVSLIEEFSYELEEMDVESNINEEWESRLNETWQSYNC